MHVIQVIPLIRGTQLESLSYFSSIPYDIGSFLQVPIQGKNQLAISISCEPVSTTKTALKAATFSLRKLPAQKNATKVPWHIKRTAELLTKRYPATLGAILFNLLPPDVKNGSRYYLKVPEMCYPEETTPQVFTARIDERFVSYQSHIRSTFARKGSVLFIVPTNTDIKHAVKELSHGIKDRIVVLSNTTSKKKLEEMHAQLNDHAYPKLIITTPTYAYIERSDILSIIIEQAASPHYVNRERPYLDHRDALITLARVAGRSIILGDTVVRAEDEYRRRNDTYLTYGEEVKRMVFAAPLSVITQTDKPKVEQPFQLFSPTLIHHVTRTIEARGHAFLYSARRGIAPVVACIDCGFIFRCPDSNTPYSLVRTEKNGQEERWFVSSTSGRKVRAADVCTQCGSWRLRERGIGIQHVYDEWREQVPDTEVMILDHTTASTTTKAQKIIDAFYAKKSCVLIGTQIALPYLYRGVDISAVISLDAARATPTWRADESLFRLLLRLRECTAKEVLVQTRSEPDALVQYATKGSIERFYDDEIALREQLKYPPFATFILLTWSGTLEAVTKAEETIKAILAPFPAHYYTNPHSTTTHSHRHALIRIHAKDTVEHETLIARIRQVPPYVKIEINPERIV